jgi:hypothetical protein
MRPWCLPLWKDSTIKVHKYREKRTGYREVGIWDSGSGQDAENRVNVVGKRDVPPALETCSGSEESNSTKNIQTMLAVS